MDQGSTIPILRQTSKANTDGPLPEEQLLSKTKSHSSPNLKMAKRVHIKPETKTWIEVTTQREGPILVVHYQPL